MVPILIVALHKSRLLTKKKPNERAVCGTNTTCLRHFPAFVTQVVATNCSPT
jgi:hypothetical protein